MNDKKIGIKLENETHWYVFFILTGYESEAIHALTKLFPRGTIDAFIPIKEMFHRYANGKIEKNKKPLFPGYVFIESSFFEDEFLVRSRKVSRNYSKIVRPLRYSQDTYEAAVRPAERSFITTLCGENRCVEASSGFIIGDRITITEGILKGKEALIRKIDRRRREAEIAMEFMGNITSIILGLDVFSKV